MGRRRVWSETLVWSEITSAHVRLLARFELELLVAVRPWDLSPSSGFASCVGRAREAGVHVGLWPMLGDGDGRWASTANAAPFASFIREAADAATLLGAAEIVFDLEPPLFALRRLTSALNRRRGVMRSSVEWPLSSERGIAEAARLFEAIARNVASRGLAVSSAIVPLFAVSSTPEEDLGFARILGSDPFRITWDHASVMAYSSLFEGWSGGLLRREDAESLVALAARGARRRFGTRAGLSLGLVGPGALGDEPAYRRVDELARDVAIARAHGVEDLALFELGALFARPPVERWLEAFVHTPAAADAPSPTMRARALQALLRGSGYLIHHAP